LTEQHPLRLAAADLGAESGRLLVGTFDGDRLALEEVHRFPNGPVRVGGTLHWDALRLWSEIDAGLRKAGAAGPVASVAVDSWGVDFGLLDGRGRLVSNPVHYRDRRTDGIPERVFALVPRDEVYATTGIQVMAINTLYQLASMALDHDPALERSHRLLLMADLFTWLLSGVQAGEYTNATTTQCLDARARDWARPMLERIGIPAAILPEVVAPGTRLGPLLPELAGATGLGGTQVVLAGSHDTASAVAGTPLASPRTAYLSSGTWSRLGLEMPGPIITEASSAANLTNEGGVAGTIRLLRNVTGLWLVQECRRALWPVGAAPTYAEITAMAEAAPPFTAFINPDDERFLHPGDLPGHIRAFCAETGQPVPGDHGTLLRVILESLALRYADTLDQLATVSGIVPDGVHIVGGGSNNTLLNRLTAGSTGLPVTAGPVEATAVGNLVLQAIATGRLGSLAEGRDLVARSFPMTSYEPEGDWAGARARFAAVTSATPR
jgi:rhamnulokinase